MRRVCRELSGKAGITTMARKKNLGRKPFPTDRSAHNMSFKGWKKYIEEGDLVILFVVCFFSVQTCRASCIHSNVDPK